MDFMAINVNQQLSKLESHLYKDAKKSKKLDTDILIQILFDLIKKKMNFESIVQNLRDIFPRRVFT